jgi:hypothetical protein
MNENESSPSANPDRQGCENTQNLVAPGGRNPRTSSAAWKAADGKLYTCITPLDVLSRSCAYSSTGHLFALPITAAAMVTLAGQDNVACSRLLGLIGSKLHSDLSQPSAGALLSISLILFSIGITFLIAGIAVNV